MSTHQLFAAALREVTEDDGERRLDHLVALHQRDTPEVFDTAAALLADAGAIRRELGARVLRELGPPGEDHRRTFSAETVPLLRTRLSTETDPLVLYWLISALGYHAGAEGLDDVLAFASHPDAAVRFHVAAALPSLINPGQAEHRAVDVLETLCHDDDADIRWYAFYALAEETTGVPAERIRAVADLMAGDDDQQIRELVRPHQSGS
jgi:HEAT repeat protein